METPDLQLTAFECQAIQALFSKYALIESYQDSKGCRRQRYMRQRTIWINDKNFKPQEQSRSIRNLITKKVIVAHWVGYKFSIRAEYFQQIYALLDNGDDEMVFQMAAVWLEVQVA
jgi:hypothetical protein